MAVNNETLKVTYDCNGSTTVFPITIDYLSDEDIKVVRYDSVLEKEATLVSPSDYSISAGNVVTGATYPSGDKITIGRDISLLQSLDLIQGDSINPNSFERFFDKIIMIAQQLKEQVQRTLKLSISDTAADLEMPLLEEMKNGYLFIDSNGKIKAQTGPVPKEWNDKYPYMINQITSYQGKFYKSKVDNNIGNVPATLGLNWKVFNLEGIKHDPLIPYELNEIVQFQGGFFKSLENDNLGNTPSIVYPDAHWEEIPTDLRFRETANYMTNDYSEINGLLYRSKIDNNKGNLNPAIDGDTNWERIFTKGDTGDIRPFDFNNLYLKDEVASKDSKIVISNIDGNQGKEPFGPVPVIFTKSFVSYTNLVPFSTDLSAWTTPSYDMTDSGEKIDGEILWKATTLDTGTLSFLSDTWLGDGNPTICSIVIRKGSFDSFTTSVHGNGVSEGQVWITFSTKTVTYTSGAIKIIEDWIDTNTVRIIFQTDPLLNGITYLLSSYASSLILGDYIFINQPQVTTLLDTIAPFTESTHSAEAIDISQTLPDKVTYDITIDNRNSLSTDGYIFSYDIGAGNLALYYSSGSNCFAVLWWDGGFGPISMFGPTMDDGTNYINRLQKFRLVVTIDFTTLSQYSGSQFFVIPNDTGVVYEAHTWQAPPDVKFSDFTTLSLGHDSGALQANALFEKFLIYSGSFSLGLPATENDIDSAITILGPALFEINGDNPRDYWTPWPKLDSKVIEIGDWDMDNIISVLIPHGIVEFTKIRSLTVMIRNDANNLIYPLNTDIEGSYYIEPSQIVLNRVTTGFFDSTNYTKTSYNRGWVTIQYEV